MSFTKQMKGRTTTGYFFLVAQVQIPATYAAL
jgi:hypothetical protein